MFAYTRNLANKYGSKALALAAAAPFLLVNSAHAAGPIDDMLGAIDLSSIATKIGALGLVIVAIALVFKGPAIAKRIISKV